MSNLAPPNPSNRQPSPEPETAAARDFSSELDAHFGLSTEITGLSESVEVKRQELSSQNRELEELEARIKAAESKLQKAGGPGQPTQTTQTTANGGAAASSTAQDVPVKQSSVSQSAKVQAAATAAAQGAAGSASRP